MGIIGMESHHSVSSSTYPHRESSNLYPLLSDDIIRAEGVSSRLIYEGSVCDSYPCLNDGLCVEQIPQLAVGSLYSPTFNNASNKTTAAEGSGTPVIPKTSTTTSRNVAIDHETQEGDRPPDGINTLERGYLCLCSDYFTGSNCQLRRKGQRTRKMENAPTIPPNCSLSPSECLVQPSLDEKAELAKRPCPSNPCLNGGICYTIYTASTPQGSSPERSRKLKNAAGQIQYPLNQRCYCPPHFHGMLCATPTPPSSTTMAHLLPSPPATTSSTPSPLLLGEMGFDSPMVLLDADGQPSTTYWPTADGSTSSLLNPLLLLTAIVFVAAALLAFCCGRAQFSCYLRFPSLKPARWRASWMRWRSRGSRATGHLYGDYTHNFRLLSRHSRSGMGTLRSRPSSNLLFYDSDHCDEENYDDWDDAGEELIGGTQLFSIWGRTSVGARRGPSSKIQMTSTPRETPLSALQQRVSGAGSGLENPIAILLQQASNENSRVAQVAPMSKEFLWQEN